jgi:hypothetical protein
MTTLVAVRKNDEIAIAADSLTTFGDTRLSAEFDRNSEKIVHYKGTHIGLCGSAAHQLVFESLLAAHGDLDFSTRRRFETFQAAPILGSSTSSIKERGRSTNRRGDRPVARAWHLRRVSMREVFDTGSAVGPP